MTLGREARKIKHHVQVGKLQDLKMKPKWEIE